MASSAHKARQREMIDNSKYPTIIQGGMGVGVSNWRLARAVSVCGQLGVVSGTFLDTVVARRLQDGDLDGSIRRALSHFPEPILARKVLDSYYLEGGKRQCDSYKSVPMHSLHSAQELIDLTVIANFVEIFLSKEGHNGSVGVNYLTKIDLPTLPSLYGAMLAGVDFVLMGAGIPRSIPAILDALSQHQSVSLRIEAQGSGSSEIAVHFDPRRYGTSLRPLKRPSFLPIVSSSTLAQSLLKKSSGSIQGFVVEHHCAGGHNAPPRGGVVVGENKEPIYGPRDEPDTAAFRKLGVPFWLAGSYSTQGRLREALAQGAVGVQIGTPFAYCDESGITEEIRQQIIKKVEDGKQIVFTDPRAPLQATLSKW